MAAHILDALRLPDTYSLYCDWNNMFIYDCSILSAVPDFTPIVVHIVVNVIKLYNNSKLKSTKEQMIFLNTI